MKNRYRILSLEEFVKQLPKSDRMLKPTPRGRNAEQIDDLPDDKGDYKRAWRWLMGRANSGLCVETSWFKYSVFKEWAEQHYFEQGFNLSSLLKTPERDAVFKESAVFIPRDIWNFVKPNRSAEAYHFRGVRIFDDGSKPRAVGYFKKEIYQLGSHDTVEEAHFAWLAWKIKCGYKLLAELDPRCWQVKEAFVGYLERMEAHLRERKEFKR